MDSILKGVILGGLLSFGLAELGFNGTEQVVCFFFLAALIPAIDRWGEQKVQWLQEYRLRRNFERARNWRPQGGTSDGRG